MTLDLSAVDTAVVHANCPDGMASAILLKDAFYGRDVKIVFAQHNTEAYENIEPRRGLLFCDLGPPVRCKDGVILEPEKLQRFLDVGAIVMDHHDTTAPVTKTFVEAGLGAFGDEKTMPGICGAALAYEHAWKPLRGALAIQEVFARKFSRLAGIRDTYQRQSPEWDEGCQHAETLMFFPKEHWLGMSFTELASRWEKEFRPLGPLLMVKKRNTVDSFIEKSYRFQTAKGTRVCVISSHAHTTDTADFLRDQVDLVLGFGYLVSDGKPKVICSTRAHTGFNCIGLAESHNGGGHTKAAGFSLELTSSIGNPYEMARKLVEEFEATQS